MRSFLTVLGIAIGVAAMITMVTVGNGVTAPIRTQIGALGANTLLVAPNTQGVWRKRRASTLPGGRRGKALAARSLSHRVRLAA